MPPWKDSKELALEKKVAALFSVLPGAGTVEHNAKILGKSGIRRQIDILITQRLGPVEYRMVIDTKRKSKKREAHRCPEY